MHSRNRRRQALKEQMEQLPEGFDWDDVQAGIYDKMPPPTRKPSWRTRLTLSLLGLLTVGVLLTYILHQDRRWAKPSPSAVTAPIGPTRSPFTPDDDVAFLVPTPAATPAQTSAHTSALPLSLSLSPKPVEPTRPSAQGPTASSAIATNSPLPPAEADSEDHLLHHIPAAPYRPESPTLAYTLEATSPQPNNGRSVQPANATAAEGEVQLQPSAPQPLRYTLANTSADFPNADWKPLPLLTLAPMPIGQNLPLPQQALHIAAPHVQAARSSLTLAAAANVSRGVASAQTPSVSSWWGYGGQVAYARRVRGKLELNASYGLQVLREEFAVSETDVVDGEDVISVLVNHVDSENRLLRQDWRMVNQRVRRTRNELSYNRYLVHHLALGARYHFQTANDHGFAVGLQLGGAYLQQAQGRRLDALGEVQDLDAASSFQTRFAAFVAPSLVYRLPLSPQLALVSAATYQQYLMAASSDLLVLRPNAVSVSFGVQLSL